MLFNGKSPKEILATDVRGPFKQLGLESHLAIQRRNGLQAMVERVRNLASAIESGGPAPSQPGATDVPSESHDHGATSADSSHQQSKSNNQPSVVASVDRSDVNRHAENLKAVTLDVEAIRAQFPALHQTDSQGRNIVYLDTASSSQKPHAVIDKEREVYEQYYANAYRGVYRFGDRISRELEQVREKVATFVGAKSTDEIFFTSGTTMGLNLVANAGDASSCARAMRSC